MDLNFRILQKAKQEKAWSLNNCIQIEDFKINRSQMLGDKAKEKHFRGRLRKFHLGKEGPLLLQMTKCVREVKAVGKIRILFLVALGP